MLVFAIVGVPGVGKTHLIKHLSDFYQTSFAAEYGSWYCTEQLNGYLDEHNRPKTTQADFTEILTGQNKWNQTAIAQAKSLNRPVCFFDTDAIYTEFFYSAQFPHSPTLLSDQSSSPINFYFFLETKNLRAKFDSPLTESNFSAEQKRLKKMYETRVPPAHIFWITEENLAKRIKLIRQIIDDKISQSTE